MLMSLGLFVFSQNQAPLQKTSRSSKENWSKSERFGVRPATQHIGPGEDTLRIDGIIAPAIAGSPRNLDTLRRMMAEGKAWILTSGRGDVLGMWIIEGIDETRTHFTSDGQPRKIEFTISLERYGEEDPDLLGELEDSL
ncbi:phage tail protein [Kiloniella laminariae]|uniref:Phage tail protein n=1 Tax=Kiloniella laminariae TaxID=454162 RepID=A0ABT4LKS6_9PROT|nr:phage tail protein [Kiloniella laminariae]MCZ4281691.1 phage tail protein [Kiloniella laminariae]